MNITEGSKFTYLGGVFTIGAIYKDINTVYVKEFDDEDKGEVTELRLSNLESLIRSGVYTLIVE